MFAVSELEGPLFRWLRELGDGVVDSPAHDRFADAAAAMQSAIAEHDWLVDDHFSVADVMCGSVLQGANARAAGTVAGTRGVRRARRGSPGVRTGGRNLGSPPQLTTPVLPEPRGVIA